MHSRREFLATLGGALGTAALGFTTTACTSASAAAARGGSNRLPRVGLQLYTVREAMKADVERTLARVAQVGYKEVEFAGYFGRTPSQIRALLATNGLTSPSTHIGLPQTADEWSRTLDDAKTAGHEWVVIPWLDAPMRRTTDDWSRFAERLNTLGTAARKADMKLAYHNHDFEFARVMDHTALDHLLGNTDRNVVDFEMDIYWVVKGGGDPFDFIARYPHRFPLMHAKDATSAPARKMVDVGSGTIDFAGIFARDYMSGMRHVFVEHDEPADPWASITNSYRYLAALEY